MKRYRFTSSAPDYRPKNFKLFIDSNLPWWCTGYCPDGAVIVAYLPDDVKLKDLWPEANNITSKAADTVIYTDRFPKPSWCK